MTCPSFRTRCYTYKSNLQGFMNLGHIGLLGSTTFHTHFDIRLMFVHMTNLSLTCSHKEMGRLRLICLGPANIPIWGGHVCYSFSSPAAELALGNNLPVLTACFPRAGLGPRGKGWIVGTSTARRLLYWAYGLVYPIYSLNW